ncbi:protein kinase [Hypoxylon crocopeplum]|nr:protein kinase [Hypoxylon crocopeplum]
MSHARKRLGLDNPGRVRQITDRGEGNFNRPNGHSPQPLQPGSYKSLPGSPEDLRSEIEDQLDRSKVISGLDHNKSYLPRNELRSILTPERVRTIVDLPCFRGYSDQDKNRLTTDIYSGSTRSRSCLKLLAILVGMEKIGDLPRHMADGMNDQCLPMITKDPTDPKTPLYCRYHKKYHQTINERRVEYRRQFSQWSYSLSALYITCDVKKHSHYVLDAGDIFPMKVGKKVPKSEITGTNEVSPDRYGGFSDVYQVQIDSSHYDFGNIGMRHPGGLFALKKLTSHNRENFNLELSSLLFSMDNSRGKNATKNLVQLLATFEVPDPSVQGSTYYLLFDWAVGTLSNFWRENQHFVGNSDHCLWMSKQIHQLCLALQCVHNERLETLKSIDHNTLERVLHGRDVDVNELYGRHGDIKPDNFLWFCQPPDLLALSDFGLGRLHTQVSRSKQNPKDIAVQATYRAPGFDLPDGLISRASDIFSLGCVLLEYGTWFLLGMHSVEHAFPSQRNGKDIYDFNSDTFFVIRPDSSGKQQPFLKPKVLSWISGLQKHRSCSWYLSDLLDIIRDKMLVPDRENRANIICLTKRMEALRRTCEDDPSYYLEAKREA